MRCVIQRWIIYLLLSTFVINTLTREIHLNNNCVIRNNSNCPYAHYGDTAIFECPIQPQYSSFRVIVNNKWELQPNDRVSFNCSSGIVKIKNITEMDAGKYKCKVENIKKKRVKNYILKVQLPLIVHNEPEIEGDSMNRIVEGDTMRAKCKVYSSPNQKHKLFWTIPQTKDHRISFKNKRRIDMYQRNIESQILIIKNVTSKDSGRYECHFSSNDSQRNSVAFAYLTVHAKVNEISGPCRRRAKKLRSLLKFNGTVNSQL